MASCDSMNRWLQPAVILVLIISGTAVLLFPNLFLWTRRAAGSPPSPPRAAAEAYPPKAIRTTALLAKNRRLRDRTSIEKSSGQRDEANLVPTGGVPRQEVAATKTGARGFLAEQTKSGGAWNISPPARRSHAPASVPTGISVPAATVAPSAALATVAAPPTPANVRPLGYVEFADGERKIVLPGTNGVRLLDEPPSAQSAASPAEAFSPAGAITSAGKAEPPREIADSTSGAPHVVKRPPATLTAKALPSAAQTQVPASVARPEAGPRRNAAPGGTIPSAKTRSADSPAAREALPSAQPQTASISASPAGVHLGFVEKADGETLAIVAEVDGIHLIPDKSVDIYDAGRALNAAAPGPESTATVEAEAMDRQPSVSAAPPSGGESSPARRQELPLEALSFERTRDSQTQGLGPPERSGLLGLPGIGRSGEAASFGRANWLAPKGTGHGPPGLVGPDEAFGRPGPRDAALAEPPPAPIQSLGYIEWADGRLTRILARGDEIRLVEGTEPATGGSGTFRPYAGKDSDRIGFRDAGEFTAFSDLPSTPLLLGLSVTRWRPRGRDVIFAFPGPRGGETPRAIESQAGMKRSHLHPGDVKPERSRWDQKSSPESSGWRRWGVRLGTGGALGAARFESWNRGPGTACDYSAQTASGLLCSPAGAEISFLRWRSPSFPP